MLLLAVVILFQMVIFRPCFRYSAGLPPVLVRQLKQEGRKWLAQARWRRELQAWELLRK